MKLRIALAPALTGVLLAGCVVVGPEYAAPERATPPAWHSALPNGVETASPALESLAQWWQGLGDATLTALVEEALAGNPDLVSARAKLREARARRSLASAQLAPNVSAAGSAQTQRNGTQSATMSELYSAGLDASWEIDIFGGLRRGVEAAQADLEATQASLRDVQVSIAAEVALNYIELRTNQARLKIARANSSAQSETHQIASWRAQAGLTSAVDVEQAHATLEQTNAEIPALEKNISEAANRIAVLLGRQPGSLSELNEREGAIPAVPARLVIGIPADILRQRPDIRAAERKIAAETARIGQAETQRYPTFGLSGSIGLEAATLGALSGGSAAVGSLASAITVPLFDGGRVAAQVDIQSAVRDQALAAYEKAVLAALQDVENALVALAKARARSAQLREAFNAARNASLYAQHRYATGIADFQPVLDSQRTLYSIEDSLQSSEADEVTALIRLYKAMGGGWSAKYDKT